MSLAIHIVFVVLIIWCMVYLRRIKIQHQTVLDFWNSLAVNQAGRKQKITVDHLSAFLEKFANAFKVTVDDQRQSGSHLNPLIKIDIATFADTHNKYRIKNIEMRDGSKESDGNPVKPQLILTLDAKPQNPIECSQKIAAGLGETASVKVV